MKTLTESLCREYSWAVAIVVGREQVEVKIGEMPIGWKENYGPDSINSHLASFYVVDVFYKSDTEEGETPKNLAEERAQEVYERLVEDKSMFEEREIKLNI